VNTLKGLSDGDVCFGRTLSVVPILLPRFTLEQIADRMPLVSVAADALLLARYLDCRHLWDLD
jgi:hypothetical protein